MKEIIKDLFTQSNKSVYEISEIFNLNKDEVKNILREFGFDKFSDRKYYLIRNSPFLKEQKEFILGCLLGNGKLKKNSKKKPFFLFIKEKNRDIILWKKLNLAKFVNVINYDGYHYSFKTSAHNELNSFHKRFFINNKFTITENIVDLLSPLSLSVFYIDRGINIKNSTIRFKTNCFSEDENNILKDIFKSKFNINSKVCEFNVKDNKQYYLSLNKINSDIYMDIINPFKEILND